MNSPKKNIRAPKVLLNRNFETINQDSYHFSYAEEKLGKQLEEVIQQQFRLEQSLIKFHQIINNLMINSKNATNILSNHLKLLNNTINEENKSPSHNEELLKMMRKPFNSKKFKKVYVTGQCVEVSELMDLNERNGTATFLTAENRMLVIDVTHISGLELKQ